MAIRTFLEDKCTGNIASITREGYQRVRSELFDQSRLIKPLLNDVGSDNFAISAAIVASFNVWDGTGVGDIGTFDWVPASLGAGVVLETPLAARTGTNGLSFVLANKQKVNLTSATAADFTASPQISFWIQPTVGYTIGGLIRLRLKHLGAKKGNRVVVQNYMVSEVIGAWVQVIIPMVDFGIIPVGLVDEIEIEGRNAQVNFFIDDFTHGVVGNAGSPIFTFTPEPNKVSVVESLNIVIIGTSTVGSDWEPLGFGPLAIVNPITIQIIKNREIDTTILIKNNSDLLKHGITIKKIIGSINTAWSFNINMGLLMMKHCRGDTIRLVVNTDLSGLVRAESTVHGYTYLENN